MKIPIIPVIHSVIGQRSISRGNCLEIVENTARSYGPSVRFARELFHPRLIIGFSSSSNIHLIRLFRSGRPGASRFFAPRFSGGDSASGSSPLSIRVRAFIFFFLAYDLLMRVPRGVLRDTSSQLMSPTLSAAALKMIETSGCLGCQKNKAFSVTYNCGTS